MFLKFPDLATLQAVLLNGAVPASLTQAAASAGFDDQGQLWVAPSTVPSRGVQNELRKLGVQLGKACGAELMAEVNSWMELVPLQKEKEEADLPPQTPVLFEMPDGTSLVKLASEILRLGNDRQSYRWLEGKGSPESPRALLRVIGPPYYSLLRALDSQSHETPRAFVERAPRIWVQFGYHHPFLNRIKVPPGQIVLLRPPRQWVYLEDAPFRDLYEIMEYQLPAVRVTWKDCPLPDRLKVRLRLARRSSPDPAELWVLRDDPVETLNAFVQNADEELLTRLAFAVAEAAQRQTIALRARPSKQGPPVIVLEQAIAYRHYQKLPNLFVPCGWEIHPPLRRDQIRRLLADDPSLLTWLHPTGQPDGSFEAERIPESAFRPLANWIDYILDRDREAMQVWIQSNQFEFDNFICEEEAARPRKPPAPEKTRPSGKSSNGPAAPADIAPRSSFETLETVAPVELEDLSSLKPVEPSEAQKQLKVLEEQFLTIEGALDAPERQALWPELARLNAEANQPDDAGLCWGNALWQKAVNPAAWVSAWFAAEARGVPERPVDNNRKAAWTAQAVQPGRRVSEIPGADLDRLLALPDPLGTDLRALAAYLVWAAQQSPFPRAVLDRLNTIQLFLEKHERLLSVRACWLTWVAVTRLTRGDVLALARARDRLLERLYTQGLRPEMDLPSFLRFSGTPTNQRFRAVRQWMQQLVGLAHEWCDAQGQGGPLGATHAYVDLMFSFGLARMSESDASRDLQERAHRTLATLDDAHAVLLKAFSHRIVQAREGKPTSQPLPEEIREQIDHKLDKMKKFVVERMQQLSRILEPVRKVNPFEDWHSRSNELDRKLSELRKLRERRELTEGYQRLLTNLKGKTVHEDRATVLQQALDVAGVVGEEFAVDMLSRLGPCIDALSDSREGVVDKVAELLEKGLKLAAHYDRREHVQGLVGRFHKLLHSLRDSLHLVQTLDTLAEKSFHSLRKFGMRDEIDALLKQIHDLLTGGKDISALDMKQDKDGTAKLRALLHVASQWYFFGKDRQAETVVNKAREVLLKGDQSPLEQTRIACVYAATVGQAPVEVAQWRLEELFQKLRGVKDTFTTSTHYSLTQLKVIESVVLAVVNDDFTMGANARRWLDEDEFLIRRRLHREFQDMKKNASH